MTLVEVLIAAGLMSVLLTLAVTLLWGTLPAWRQAERQSTAFQNAVTVLESVARTLRQARRIDVPTWRQLDAGYAPIAGKTGLLIVTLPQGLTGLTWDPASAQLEEISLPHIPAPDEALPPPTRRLASSGPLQFQRLLRHGIALLRIQVTCQDAKLLPVETAIRLDPRVLQEDGP